jgi:trehalose 6-phosphate phosphatase
MLDKPLHLVPDLRQVAFLFDVDGTLLDLAPTPREVWVPPTLRESLLRLWERTGEAVAFVSGRTLEELDLIFTPLQFAGVGGHGAEFRESGKAPILRLAAELGADLKRSLATAAKLGPGILMEDKGSSLALHYRLAPDKGPAVETLVYEMCAKIPVGTVEILPGKFVIEVKQVGFNKGMGVRKLMSHEPFAKRRPLFFGDDVTDENVFAILPEFSGQGYSVGRKVAGTDGNFASPAQVRSWLDVVAAS